MRTLTETSVSVLFDGGNQSGMLGMYYATRAAIERAQLHGIALVGVDNIWMSGRSAYYVEMVARAGLMRQFRVAQFHGPLPQVQAVFVEVRPTPARSPIPDPYSLSPIPCPL